MSTGRRFPAAGIRAKLFLASLALTGVSVAATDAFVTRRVDSELTNRIRADLLVRLALVEREASAAQLPMERIPAWKALADDLGARSHARVTVIRRDGLLLADSDVSGADLLEFYGALLEMPPAVRAERAATLLGRLGLESVATRRVSTYSKGTLQRLGFVPFAGSNQADDTTIRINGYAPGATPFISKLSLTASNTAVLKEIQFKITLPP